MAGRGLTALAVLASSLTVGAVTASPAAAAPVVCVDSLYLINGAAGTVHPVDFAGVVGPELYEGNPRGNPSANQLGIGKAGAYAVNATSSYIYEHDFGSGQTAETGKAGGAGTVAGAVSPVGAGYFYYGGYVADAGTTYLALFAYDAATNRGLGEVARIGVPSPAGTNGDIAFASDGTLYYLNASSSSTAAHLYRFDLAVPTSGPSTTFRPSDSTQIATTSSSSANGIAFGSDGFLYLGNSSSLTKVNPITGATVGSPRNLTATGSTDLGSCAGPNTIEAGVTLPDNRLTPGDQFVTTITGPEYGPGAQQQPVPTGTTTGSDVGPQDEPAETAGPAIVLPDQTYTATVTGAPGTDIDDYVVGYVCADADGTRTRSGHGTSFTVTPTAGTGVTEDCTFTAQNPVDLTKTVSPKTFSRAGDTLTYTFVASNDDATPLADFRLEDPMDGLSPITCVPVEQGEVLGAGQSTTCTATYTVTEADVRTGNSANPSAKTNRATVTTAPRSGSSLVVASASSSTQSANTATPLTAADDTAATPYDTPVTFSVTGNDTAGSSAIVATSSVFTAASATDHGKRLTTDQGSWQIGTDGRVTFTPAAGYTGTTPTVQYRASDANGFTSSATITVTVRPGPTATADTASTRQNTDVTFAPLGNDTAGPLADGGPGTFQRSTVRFPVAGQPDGAVRTPDGLGLSVPNEGGYTIDPVDGRVTFDPVASFRGAAGPVTYTARDHADNPVTSTATVTVRPVDPTATDDAANTPFDTPVTLPGATNDTPGTDDGGTPGDRADDTTVAIVPGSTAFPTQAAGEVTDGGQRLSVTGEGAWVVQADGSVTFSPSAGYVGTATTVTYRIQDANGTTDTGTLRVTVRPGPDADDDTARTPYDTDVTASVLGNDTPGARADGSAGSWQLGTLAFPSQPSGTESDGGRTLTVTGQGVYTIDPATGRITFDPATTYAGTATPVTYEVRDQAGNPTTARLTVTVRPGPSADADTATTGQNVTVRDIDVLDGDTPGPLADGDAGSWRAGSLVLEETPGTVVSDSGRTLTVAGEGVYSVESDDRVTFDPEPRFAGTATPVRYRVTDSHGNLAAATLTVTVTAIRPTANDDSAATRFGVPVALEGMTDDTAGAGSAPLVPAATVFPDTGQPAGATVTDGGKTLTLSDQGTWTVRNDGSVLFTPAAAFTGTAATVRYRIEDANGTRETAALSVTVRPGPLAQSDSAGTRQNVTVTLEPLGNDTRALDVDGTTRATVDPGTLVLVATRDLPQGSSLARDGRTLDMPGEGVWSVGPDGRVSFDPLSQFTGVAAPVTYRARDSFDNTVTSTMTVSVDAVVPAAVDDAADTTYGTPVLVDVLDNDLPAAGGPLDPATLRVVDPTTGQPVLEVGVPDEGAWSVVDGKVGFTPADGFTGVATTLGYVVSDANGTPARASVRVSVGAPGEAVPTRASTTRGRPVTLDVLAGVSPAQGERLVVGSLCLVPGTVAATGKGAGVGARDCVRKYAEEGVGTWVVEPDGTVTFTPADGFTGTATTDFRVADTGGNLYVETAVVVVKGVAARAGDDDQDEARGGAEAGGLPDTGGPPLGLLLLGTLSIAGGVTLLRRSRRTA